MMVDANTRVIFIGIETPNEAALRETRKLQNLRKSATMLEKVHTIQRAGIDVWRGTILGLASCDVPILDAQRAFIKQAWIVNDMVTMLAAVPRTPLHARLLKEGRQDRADNQPYGTNVVRLHLSREAQHEGNQSLHHLRRHPLQLIKPMPCGRRRHSASSSD